jgi:hypothetical protein
MMKLPKNYISVCITLLVSLGLIASIIHNHDDAYTLLNEGPQIVTVDSIDCNICEAVFLSNPVLTSTRSFQLHVAPFIIPMVLEPNLSLTEKIQQERAPPFYV